MSADLLGRFLRWTGPRQFRGKGRLLTHWLRSRRGGDVRRRAFAPGLELACDLGIPYEAMVWLGMEEERDLRVLAKLLRPGDVFVDCGANIGLWSLSAAACVGPGGKVIAIEPNPASRRKLEAAASDPSVRNIEIVPAAASARRGTVHLEAAERHNLAHIVDAPQPGTFSVDAIPLDEIVGVARVSGCKIDVEGHEIHVLEGAARTLARCRPWVCVEFNTLLEGKTRLGDWPVHRHLAAQGYRPFAGEAVLQGGGKPFGEDARFAGHSNLFYLPDPA